MVYRGEPSGPSFFLDMATVATRGHDVGAAAERLRNQGEPGVQSHGAAAAELIPRDVLPPVWLTREFARLTNAMRVTTGLMRSAEVPIGAEAIDVNRLPGQAAPRPRPSPGGAVRVKELTKAAVQAEVKTYTTVQALSMRVLTHSPINLDRVILADLAAGFVSQLDGVVLNGRLAGARGVLWTAGTNTLSYADAEPTTAELYIMLADAVQRSSRHGVPDGIVMHPRRWEWLIAGWGNIQARLTLSGAGHSTSSALLDPPPDARGAVGVLVGLPVYLDDSVPTNKGPGRNEDRIIVGRFSDSVVAEGTTWTDVVENDDLGFLQAEIQMHSAVAFSWAGNPGALAVVVGSGLVDPYPARKRRRRTNDIAGSTPPHMKVRGGEPELVAAQPVPTGGGEHLLRTLQPEVANLAGLRDTADVVLAASLERIGAEAGCIMLPDGQSWRVGAGNGIRPLEYRLRLDAAHWLVEEVVRRQHGVLIQESDIVRSRMLGAPLAHWRHLLAVPIPGVDGVIMLGRDTPPFAERDLRSVASVAEEAEPLLRSALILRELARALMEHADEE